MKDKKDVKFNIPPDEEKKIRKAIDEMLPDEKKVYIVKTTPAFTELINKFNELTQLFESFLKTSDKFVNISESR